MSSTAKEIRYQFVNNCVRISANSVRVSYLAAPPNAASPSPIRGRQRRRHPPANM